MELNQGYLKALGDAVYDPWEMRKEGREAGELIIKQLKLLIDKPMANGLEAAGNAMMPTCCPQMLYHD
jgi:hypothetical protein